MNSFAAIDIGAHTIKLKIVQFDNRGNLEVLEDINREIYLGKDSFKDGFIRSETIEETIDTLQYFKKLMSDYSVINYKAVATSAINESKNALFIIDQIYINTGLRVLILEETIEKYLTYQSLSKTMPSFKSLKKEGLVIIESGSGNLEVTFYKNGNLLSNYELNLGPMRLHYLLEDTIKDSENHKELITDYIYSSVESIIKYLKNKKIKNILAIGGEIKKIKNIFFENKSRISLDEFDSFYEDLIVQNENVNQLLFKSGLDIDEILTSMSIFKLFIDTTEPLEIVIPDVSLRDGVISDYISRTTNNLNSDDFNKDIISLAKNISKKYQSSTAHINYVEKTSIKIFNFLKDKYNIPKSSQKLLRVSIILHEIGKFTKMKNYEEASFMKIRSMNILGLSSKDLEIIANININSSSNNNNISNLKNSTFNDEEKLLIFKLAGIQKLSDSIDKSKKQKIKIRKLELQKKHLIIYISSKDNIGLELYSIEKNKSLFQDTFGLKLSIEEVK